MCNISSHSFFILFHFRYFLFLVCFFFSSPVYVSLSLCACGGWECDFWKFFLLFSFVVFFFAFLYCLFECVFTISLLRLLLFSYCWCCCLWWSTRQGRSRKFYSLDVVSCCCHRHLSTTTDAEGGRSTVGCLHTVVGLEIQMAFDLYLLVYYSL